MTSGTKDLALPNNRRQSEFCTGDGLRLCYVVDDFTPPWKSAETIVLLHANMGSSERFRAWIPILAGHYRVVRWDMRGHGASAIPAEDMPLSIERLTADLIELLDHLGLSRAHVAGSSTGGIIGMHAAATRPERVATLSAYAALPGLARSAGRDRYIAWTEALEREGVRSLLRRTIGSRFSTDQLDPRFLDWFIEQAGRNDARFIGRLLRMLVDLDLSDLLPGIRCPTLFVVPGADPEQSGDDYGRLRHVPNHRFVVFDGMRHNITDAAPTRCAAELLEFLDGSTARARGTLVQ